MIMSMLAALMNQVKYGTIYDGEVYLPMGNLVKKMMRAIMKMSNSRSTIPRSWIIPDIQSDEMYSLIAGF